MAAFETQKERIKYISRVTGVNENDPLVSWPRNNEWKNASLDITGIDIVKIAYLVPSIIKNYLDGAEIPGNKIIDLIYKQPPGTCGLSGSSILKAVLEVHKENVEWDFDDFDIFFMEDGNRPSDWIDLATIFCDDLIKLGFVEDDGGRLPSKDDYGSIHSATITSVRNFYFKNQKIKKIQVITKGYTLVKERPIEYLVANFDFDPLKMYFDGRFLHISEQAADAIVTRTLGIPTKISTERNDFRIFADRIMKYMFRGFTGEPQLIVVIDSKNNHFDAEKDIFEQLELGSSKYAFANIYTVEFKKRRFTSGVNIELLCIPKLVKSAQ